MKKLLPTLLAIALLGAIAFVAIKVVFSADGPCAPREPSPPTGAG